MYPILSHIYKVNFNDINYKPDTEIKTAIRIAINVLIKRLKTINHNNKKLYYENKTSIIQHCHVNGAAQELFILYSTWGI